MFANKLSIFLNNVEAVFFLQASKTAAGRVCKLEQTVDLWTAANLARQWTANVL